MTKLIVQIPCFNEAETLPLTLADLPRRIDGIDLIETQVVDDGSIDRTADVARAEGVTHIVSLKKNRGLANAFKLGVDNALRNGADIMVNTDADNQYVGADIVKLVGPILRGEADVVIGCRPISDHPEFSLLKKKLQIMGSALISRLAKTDVSDATSGFRAYNRDALLHLNIFSDFSYTLETIIQCGIHNLKIATVPVRVNPKTRDSRLFRNIPHYLWESLRSILKILIIYRSGPFFTFLASITLLIFLALLARYLIIVLAGGGEMSRFWPSVVMAGAFLVLSVQFYLVGILCALLHSGRKMKEEILYRLRKMEANPLPENRSR